MPTPETLASSSSLAFTVTTPAPATEAFPRLALRSAAFNVPAPASEIVSSSARPAMVPAAAPAIDIARASPSSLLASMLAAPSILSSRRSPTVIL